MSEWTSTRLGDLISITRGTTYKSMLLNQPGPVLLGLASIQRDGGFRSDKLRTYGGDSPAKLLVKPGELYASLKDVTQTGDLLGSVARVPRTGPVGRLSQDTVRLDFISDKVDPDFLYLSLLSPRYRAWCRQHATGTTNLGLPRDDFLGFEVVHPADLDGQRKIAMVLGSIDDLIENNRRRVGVLEEMARAIYREWFVHFRFPGHETIPLVDSLLGPVPSGWTAGHVDDLMLLQRGFDLPTKDREAGPIPVMGASGVQGSHAVAKVQGPGVTTGRSGTVGVVAYVPVEFWPLNTSLWVKEFRLATPRFAYFLLGALDLKRSASGAAVPTLDRKVVHALPSVCPPAAVIEQWDLTVIPMFEAAQVLRSQSSSLFAIRGGLLPKLVTGQIDVSAVDLDGLLEGAVA